MAAWRKSASSGLPLCITTVSAAMALWTTPASSRSRAARRRSMRILRLRSNGSCSAPELFDDARNWARDMSAAGVSRKAFRANSLRPRSASMFPEERRSCSTCISWWASSRCELVTLTASRRRGSSAYGATNLVPRAEPQLTSRNCPTASSPAHSFGTCTHVRMPLRSNATTSVQTSGHLRAVEGGALVNASSWRMLSAKRSKASGESSSACSSASSSTPSSWPSQAAYSAICASAGALSKYLRYSSSNMRLRLPRSSSSTSPRSRPMNGSGW
mmetsp:Transcript_39520/g.112063  ORF Transcript_39520/g.112063 Transcript_39520/m.112063 type:complete len:273 (-) Transcript_39520:291-1109(-)